MGSLTRVWYDRMYSVYTFYAARTAKVWKCRQDHAFLRRKGMINLLKMYEILKMKTYGLFKIS